MGRENKKEAVAALHREQIMRAAEKLLAAGFLIAGIFISIAIIIRTVII